MVEDEELEEIKLRRLREMLGERTVREVSETPGEKPKSAPNKPVDLTQETFKDAVQNNPLVVVDCWAPWCGPCHMVSPIVESLAEDYAGRILFGKLNVDENPNVAMQYGITSIPTLLVFKNGRLVDRIIGAMPRQRLEQRIKRHL